MKVTFVVRVHKLDTGRLGFYVPKNVIECYGITGRERILETSSVKWREKDMTRQEVLPDLGTSLHPHPAGLRGVIPRWTSMPEPGTLVELTLDLA
jgi:hypothetical protein